MKKIINIYHIQLAVTIIHENKLIKLFNIQFKLYTTGTCERAHTHKENINQISFFYNYRICIENTENQNETKSIHIQEFLLKDKSEILD